MTDPNDHAPFNLRPARERDVTPTEPGIGMLPRQRRPGLPPPLPPSAVQALPDAPARGRWTRRHTALAGAVLTALAASWAATRYPAWVAPIREHGGELFGALIDAVGVLL